jgi:uncharacterized phosphatase
VTGLLLVRHGESTWNAAGRWQGRADAPLSELGRHQAQLAGAALGTFDAIVSSPLERARDTALIIAEELGQGPVLIEDRLIERDAGEWSGLTKAEIEVAWPGYLAEQRRPPGYEHDEPMLERLTAALDDISTEFGDATVLVVCHGGVVYCLETWLDAPFERVGNLGARWIHTEGNKTRLGDRAELIDHDSITLQAPGQL